MSSVAGAPGQGAAMPCWKCGQLLPTPPDLEPLAVDVDAKLAAEYRRPILRTEWAGSPPDGLVENLFPWLTGVRERRAVWERGQALWVDRVLAEPPTTCPVCRDAGESATAPDIGVSQQPPAGGAQPAAPEANEGAPHAERASASNEHDLPTVVIPRSALEPRHVRLVVVDGPVHGHRFGLAAPVTTIGRSIACQVTIGDPDVAQEHARVHRRGGRWFVEDVPGSGGTYVNDQKLHAAQELRHGDVIRVGSATLRFDTDDR